MTLLKTKVLFFIFFLLSLMQLHSRGKIYHLLLANKDIVYRHFHVNDKVKEDGGIAPGENMGTIQTVPEIKSEKFEKELALSYEAYKAGDYKKAAQLLARPSRQERDNPFILDQYAKSLYWFNRRKSFQVYSKLVNLVEAGFDEKAGIARFTLSNKLDNIAGHAINSELIELWNDLSKKKKGETYIIDSWFTEAYWKKGTLHMDRREYLEGAYEITRALYYGYENAPDKVLEQAFNYLTEAYYYLGKYNLALHCASVTKKINSSGTYVDYYVNLSREKLAEKESRGTASDAMKIFNDLYSMVVKSKKGGQHIPGVISLVKEKIDAGELKIEVNELKIDTYLDGAEFRFEKGDNPNPMVYINRNLVDLYKKQPSLVLAILMHELKHAHDYFAYREAFVASTGNVVERYLYEMDAAYIEVLFIKNYLEKKYKLTDFEHFMLASNERDNLLSYSIFIHATDMDLIYRLQKLRHNDQNEEDSVKELIETGAALIEKFDYPEGAEEYQKFAYLTPVRSYIKYVPMIYFEILYNKREDKISGKGFQVSKHSPELAEILNKLEKVYRPYHDEYSDYFAQNLEFFNNLDEERK